MSRHLSSPSVSDKYLCVSEMGRRPSRSLPKHGAAIEVGSDIQFDAKVLDTFDVKGFLPLHYDILVLCAAIEFADRRWKRPLSWRRTLNVTIPVIDLKRWQRPDVLSSLRSVLNHLTGDTWHFQFVQARNTSPIGSRQIPLDFGKTKSFAVAYSNGLDSRAVSALCGSEQEALCVRVSGNQQRRKDEDAYFTHIPFKVAGYRSAESSFRSRGFQFAAVTAIAAHLSSIPRIVVPESGQGALGPAMLPLANIYADYRNHPVFFRKMERFIRSLLEYEVRFEQPRLWFTKGQTLKEFLCLDGKSKRHLTETRSCWQTRRIVNQGKRKHCGLCAACLLRRLSLFAADVREAPRTYVVHNLTTPTLAEALAGIPDRADRDIMIEYGSVGARHLQHLADMSSLPDEQLRVHASQIALAIGETYSDTLENLRKMLLVHAVEWRAFLSAQGEESFLNTWMDGGRHVRSE